MNKGKRLYSWGRNIFLLAGAIGVMAHIKTVQNHEEDIAFLKRNSFTILQQEDTKQLKLVQYPDTDSQQTYILTPASE